MNCRPQVGEVWETGRGAHYRLSANGNSTTTYPFRGERVGTCGEAPLGDTTWTYAGRFRSWIDQPLCPDNLVRRVTPITATALQGQHHHGIPAIAHLWGCTEDIVLRGTRWGSDRPGEVHAEYARLLPDGSEAPAGPRVSVVFKDRQAVALEAYRNGYRTSDNSSAFVPGPAPAATPMQYAHGYAAPIDTHRKPAPTPTVPPDHAPKPGTRWRSCSGNFFVVEAVARSSSADENPLGWIVVYRRESNGELCACQLFDWNAHGLRDGKFVRRFVRVPDEEAMACVRELNLTLEQLLRSDDGVARLREARARLDRTIERDLRSLGP